MDMKEEEWRNLKRPYEIFPNNADWDEGWHINTCDKCNEVIGFEEYPSDGSVLCVECGLKISSQQIVKERLGHEGR